MNDVHVITFGNLYGGDDGFGCHVAVKLRRTPLPEGVRVFDAGTSGLSSLSLFEGCRHAVVVDAVRCAEPCGTLFQWDYGDLQALDDDNGLPGHAQGVGAVLKHVSLLALEFGLPRITLIGAAVGPVTSDSFFSDTLTVRMKEAVGTAAQAVVNLFRKQEGDGGPGAV